MRFALDRNVVMQRMTVKGNSANVTTASSLSDKEEELLLGCETA
jgi:hypothetical protein